MSEPRTTDIVVVGVSCVAGLVLGFGLGLTLGVITRAGALSWWLTALMLLLAYLAGGAVANLANERKRKRDIST